MSNNFNIKNLNNKREISANIIVLGYSKIVDITAGANVIGMVNDKGKVSVYNEEIKYLEVKFDKIISRISFIGNDFIGFTTCKELYYFKFMKQALNKECHLTILENYTLPEKIDSFVKGSYCELFDLPFYVKTCGFSVSNANGGNEDLIANRESKASAIVFNSDKIQNDKNDQCARQLAFDIKENPLLGDKQNQGFIKFNLINRQSCDRNMIISNNQNDILEEMSIIPKYDQEDEVSGLNTILNIVDKNILELDNSNFYIFNSPVIKTQQDPKSQLNSNPKTLGISHQTSHEVLIPSSKKPDEVIIHNDYFQITKPNHQSNKTECKTSKNKDKNRLQRESSIEIRSIKHPSMVYSKSIDKKMNRKHTITKFENITEKFPHKNMNIKITTKFTSLKPIQYDKPIQKLSSKLKLSFPKNRESRESIEIKTPLSSRVDAKAEETPDGSQAKVAHKSNISGKFKEFIVKDIKIVSKKDARVSTGKGEANKVKMSKRFGRTSTCNSTYKINVDVDKKKN